MDPSPQKTQRPPAQKRPFVAPKVKQLEQLPDITFIPTPGLS